MKNELKGSDNFEICFLGEDINYMFYPKKGTFVPYSDKIDLLFRFEIEMQIGYGKFHKLFIDWFWDWS